MVIANPWATLLCRAHQVQHEAEAFTRDPRSWDGYRKSCRAAARYASDVNQELAGDDDADRLCPSCAIRYQMVGSVEWFPVWGSDSNVAIWGHIPGNRIDCNGGELADGQECHHRNQCRLCHGHSGVESAQEERIIWDHGVTAAPPGYGEMR